MAEGQQEFRKIPVVVFTSSNNPGDIERAYELGAAAYIIKTAEPGALTKCMGAIRDFWLEQNTPPGLAAAAAASA